MRPPELTEQRTAPASLSTARVGEALRERYGRASVLADRAAASTWRVAGPTGVDLVVKAFRPDHHAAYRREVAAAWGTRHPRIVPCVDTLHLPGGESCIVYVLIDGGDLRRLLTATRCTPALVEQVLRDLLSALGALHRAGCLHNDVKPENVLVRRVGDDTHYLLTDLGCAMTLAEARAGTPSAGTPAYSAPERLMQGGFGPASDLYSVGILAFELLAGHLPFQGDVAEVLRAQLSRPAPLQRLADARWREFVARLLDKDPQARYSDADAALQALGSPRTEGHVPAPAPRREPMPSATPSSPPEAALGGALRWVPLEKPFPCEAPLQLLAGPASSWVGAVTDDEFVLLAPRRAPGACRRLPGAAWAVAGRDLVGVRDGRLLRYRPEDGRQQAVCEVPLDEGPPLALAVDARWIACLGRHGLVVMDRLQGRLCGSAPTRTYGSQPLVALGEHCVAVSAGLCNERLELHRMDGSMLNVALATGPWVALSWVGDGFIGASLDLGDHKCLMVQVLGSDGRFKARRLMPDMAHVSATRAGLWLVDAGSGRLGLLDRALNWRLLPPLDHEILALTAHPSGTGVTVLCRQPGAKACSLWVLQGAWP